MMYALRVLGAAAILAGPAVSPAAGTTLFGLVNTGEVFASSDAGVTWSVRSTLPVRDAVAIAAGATSADLMLLTESGSFFRSGDAGVSWLGISAIPASDLVAMVSSPAHLLALARSGSVYASTDAGDTWNAVGTITASDVIAATQGSAVHVAVTRSGTVYESSDGGVSWAAISAVTTSDVVGLASHSGSLWLLTGAGDVAESQDAGATWAFVSTLSQVGMRALARSNGELVATTTAGEVAGSASGTGWTWRGVINQLAVRALGSDAPTTVSVASQRPISFEFSAPWPNPARTRVSFALDLDTNARVDVSVFDLAGRRVDQPVRSERVSAGRSVRSWTPAALEPGVYLLRANVGGAVRHRRIVWVGGGR